MARLPGYFRKVDTRATASSRSRIQALQELNNLPIALRFWNRSYYQDRRTFQVLTYPVINKLSNFECGKRQPVKEKVSQGVGSA